MNEQRATFILTGDLPEGERKLYEQQIVIGSRPGCHLRLDEHFTISGEHASIEWDGENFYLTDADPANVTLVNHREAEYDEPVAVAGGDIVQIGPYMLELKTEGAELRVEVSRLLVKSSFIVERAEADKKIIQSWEDDVLLICNPPDQLASGAAGDKLILNHPKVSPLHAGVSRFKDPLDPGVSSFYLIDLTPVNSTYLNGRLLRTDVPVALSDQTVVQIGPFNLTFTLAGETLRVVVVIMSVTAALPSTPLPEEEASEAAVVAQERVAANALRIFWAKRTRQKAARTSPLQSSGSGSAGKVRYKWRATTDLARPWPFTLLFWCAVVPVAVFAWVLVCLGLSVFSPRALSAAHTRANFVTDQPIAQVTNANSCMSCHTMRTSMETNCASCHQTEAFSATVTPPHQAAGIGCISCHSEHRGAEFRPGIAPLNASFQPGVRFDETCAGCHNDQNAKLYRGKRVFTPHGGTFGYPVVNGRWKWKGLDEETWQQKPEELRQLVANWPVASQDEDGRRSAQFHALHLERVRTTGGLAGVEGGYVSCSTCHKSYGATLDRETPRTTCAACHSGKLDAQTGRALLGADTPNCTSCHVQHVKSQRHWNPSLLADARATSRR